MKKYRLTAVAILLALVTLFVGCQFGVDPSAAQAAPAAGSRSVSASQEFQKQVIYFLFVDRFFDGNPNNNAGLNSAQYDASRTNWKKHWGGDIQGIIDKLDYLKEMGITSIWVTPLVDNINVLTKDGDAPYHGYWGRNFFDIDERLGTWSKFDELITKMHSPQYNMKLILDYAPNHSNPNDEGEFGALFRTSFNTSGQPSSTWKVTDYPSDTAGNWYNRNGGIAAGGPSFGWEWDDPWAARYKNLFNLSDFNQDKSNVQGYLADALEMWLRRGVDAVRLDAVKHMNISYTQSLTNTMRSRLGRDVFFFGEWMDASAWVNSGLNAEARTYANTTGSSLLDFGYQKLMMSVLTGSQQYLGQVRNMRDLSYYLRDREIYWANPLDQVVFLDNHDAPRLMVELVNAGQNTTFARQRVDLGLAITMTVRGVPCIYYATEHYAANFTTNSFGQKGNDPYNREMMPSFATTTSAFQLIKKLSNLKQTNKALQDGSYTEKWADNTLIAYERKSGNDVVVVVANMGPARTQTVGNLSLPNGTYTNVLGTNTVNISGGSGSFSLAQNGVIVLARSAETKVATPSFNPPAGMITAGTTVTISTSTPGATIYYTTNGTTPTTSSPSGAAGSSTASVTLSAAATLRAIAVKSGLTTSDVASASYTIGTGLKLHFYRNSVANWPNVNCYYWGSNGSPAANTWPGTAMTNNGDGWFTITIPGATSANVIFNNGSSQTVDLARSGEGWFVPTGTSSGKITGTWYSSNPYSNVAAPTFNPAAGAVTAGTVVTISTSTPGATIYYTTNGSTPTTSSASGAAGSSSAAVTVNAAMTIKAIAVKTGLTTSPVVSAAYTITTSVPGRLTVNFKAGANAENVSFPGDANNWSLTANTLSVAAGQTQSFQIANGVTSTTLPRGNSTTHLELKLVTNASWNNQWSFGTWTRSSNITLLDSNRQIAIACQPNQEVILTIDVSTLTLTAVVK